MEATSSLTGIRESENISIDTSFVLFFLAVDLGQNLGFMTFEIVFLAITLMVVAVLPYFINPEEKPEFGNWLLGRASIVTFALMLGVMFKQTLGVVLPEAFIYLPFTLLIVTAMVSCYLQFYTFFRLRSSN